MNRKGLTLMELLVVLLILSILTLVAVQATDMVVEQARFDATQRTLQNVHDAVLGPLNAQGLDGTPIVTGFVADMGRLPRTMLEDRGSGVMLLTMKDLWNSPDSVAFPFAIRKPPSPDDDVSVPCGWRGPYLRLPPGSDRLLDGWGQELATPMGAVPGYNYGYLRDGGDAPLTTAGQPIALVRSLGRANNLGGVDYEGDTQVAFNANEFVGTIQGTVKVQVFDKDGLDVTDKLENGLTTVKVFVPDPTNAVALAVMKTTDKTAALDGSSSFMAGDFTAGYVSPGTVAGQVFAGPRVIRATYAGKFKTVDLALKSTPMTLVVRPGANVVQQLRIVHKLDIN